MLLTRRKFLLSAAYTSIFGLSSAAYANTPKDFQSFSFAYITDGFLTNGEPDSYKLTQESQLFLQDVVKNVNKALVDFVIFGGNQVEGLGTDMANWNLFLDVVQGITVPWSFVLGDSDLGPGQDKMKTFGPDWKGRGIVSNNPYWSLSPVQNVHLIGLDTAVPGSPTGFVSREQIDWLKTDLADNKDKFTIVFSHHPLLPPFPYGKVDSLNKYLLPQADLVREVINGAPQVRLCLSGHLGINQVQREGDVWYGSCPALDIYPCAFKIFRVTPQYIAQQTVSVNFPALVKKAERFYTLLSPLRLSGVVKPDKALQIAEGQKADKSAHLDI